MNPSERVKLIKKQEQQQHNIQFPGIFVTKKKKKKKSFENRICHQLVGNGNPLQYSCLENSTERGAWWATVHGVTKSWT